MLQKLKIKTRLLLPLSILILMVLILSISIISNQYSKRAFLLELERNTKLATNISKFVHSTQKERAMTSGFLASHGTKFTTELREQRVLTNQKIEQLSFFATSIQNEKIAKKLHQALKLIPKLYQIRDDVDHFQTDVSKSIAFYSKMNEKFLNLIIEISKISKLPIITQNLLAYINFLEAKETVGIERAVGTALLSETSPEKSLKVSFITLVSIEKLYTKLFFQYASTKAKATYKRYHRGKEIDEVQHIRDILLYQESTNGYHINAEYWFENITTKIDKLKTIDDYLASEILSNIHKELEKTTTLFNNLFFITIVSILLFLLIVNMVVKLLRSEKRLKNLLDKYIISSTTNTKGVILDASDAFCDISGYTKEELIGKPHSIVRHADMPKSAFKEMWKTIKEGKVWDGKVKNRKKDGGYYWVYAHIEPLFNKKDEIEGYVAIRIDITDSIHLEEELVRSKAKDKTLLHQSKLAQMGEMISMIAHQWRQPLTAISATASDLYMKNILDSYEKEYFDTKLKRINEFSQHLSHTIDDFRNFYKEDKKKEFILHSQMAKGACEIVESSLQYKHIALQSDFSCEKKVYVLTNELRQVILNLIKNSEDILMEKKIQNPYIKIRTYDDETHSYLEVIDNGGGIQESLIEKIFDPYFSTKTKKDGTGLGLYMSKMIVEEHCGGDLLIENTKDGVKFIIKLPIPKESLDAK